MQSLMKSLEKIMCIFSKKTTLSNIKNIIMLEISTFQFAYGLKNSPPGKKLKMQDAIAVQYKNRSVVQQKHKFKFYTKEEKSDFIWLSVADGVSSSPSASLASRTFLEILHGVSENSSDDISEQNLSIARFEPKYLAKKIRSAFSKWQEKYAVTKNEGASTTLASLVIENNRICAVNCGDSRIWRIRTQLNNKTKWEQLSLDHTYFQHMLEAGEIMADSSDIKEEYASIYQGLMHCLTLGDNVGEADWMDYGDDSAFMQSAIQLQPNLHIFNGNVESGDVYLLATDGLHDSVNEEQLYELWSGELSLETNVHALSTAYKQAGCLDDCSIIACALN